MAGCTGGIGWLGACKVGGHVLPFSSAQATEEIQIITPTGIGGRNNRYYSKYMHGKHAFRGNASFQLYSGFASAVQWLLNKATQVCPISSTDGSFVFSPAGNTTYTLPGDGGTAAIESISLSSTAGSPNGIQGSVSIISTKFDKSDSGLAGTLIFETPGFYDDGNFLPWYSTDITCTGFGDSSLINNYAVEWSLNIKNDIFMRYGLCTDDDAKRNPQAVRYGMMDVTGTIKYWSPDGSFDGDDGDNLSIRYDLSTFSIDLGKVIITNDGTPSRGANSPVFKELQFRALAPCNGGAPVTVS